MIQIIIELIYKWTKINYTSYRISQVEPDHDDTKANNLILNSGRLKIKDSESFRVRTLENYKFSTILRIFAI